MNPTDDGYALLIKALKLAFYVTLVVFVFPVTWMGYTFFIGPVEFTPFGFTILFRMVLQLPLSWANNGEKSTKVRRAIIMAIQEVIPGTKLRTKPWVRFDLWVEQVEQIVPNLEENLPAVISILRKKYDLTRYYKTAMVIPIYEVSHEEAQAMLEALNNQLLKPSRIDAVVNNPTNTSLIEFVRNWIEALPDTDRWRWHFTSIEIANKRAAQARGFKNHFDHRTFASINVDSDVVAHRWANLVTALTYALFPDVEGITSNVRVMPTNTSTTSSRARNLWQWMIYWFTVFRYIYANNIERAAESFFGGVICLSGPWMAIRTKTIPIFMEDWLNQRFRGVHFRPGDDRFATWWLNKLHRKTIYQPDIIVWTDAPFTMDRYQNQQLRWSQSGFVNFAKSITKGQILDLPLWSGFDTIYLGLFIYNLLFEFFRITHLFFSLLGQFGWETAWAAVDQYFWLFVAISLFRGIYAAVTSHNIHGLIMSFYLIIFARVQVGARLGALYGLYKSPTKASGAWLGRVERDASSTKEL